MEGELQQLGLTQVESKLYRALLDIGRTTPGVLSRKTGVHRRIVYDALDRLTHKGLAGYIVENNKKVYQASDPQEFKSIIKAQENTLKSIMPQMKQMYSLQQTKRETLFFTGTKGLKHIFNDQLRAGKEILIMGASLKASEILKFYFEHYDKERVRKKMKVKILTHNAKAFRKTPFSKVKQISHTGPAAINIYGNKVAIVYWSKKRPFAILINQKEIADSYKAFFKMLWK